ncbi:NAD(P)(+) transhydrogenase (Re/Si-specific) subunit beta [Mycobacterium tuberculosis]
MNLHYLVEILYIISFSLFIYGLMGLTGPKTAVRGNLIAAAVMTIAVAATLVMIRHTSQWPLIIAGLVVGVVLGVPPARLTKMTAMPQLVAFFNGVGGGTVALIALSEFIDTTGFFRIPARRVADRAYRVAPLFAAIIGSISFWGLSSRSASCRRSSPGG